MSTRVLIVDDEPLARRGVAIRLAGRVGVEIVGERSTGEEAIEAVTALHPDLIFLDVEMPGMNGFDVLRALPERAVPAVIFLTAHEDYALEAFEVEALDYLLKPLDDERFASALARAERLLSLRRTEFDEADSGSVPRSEVADDSRWVKRLAVRNSNNIQFVPVDDIDWIEGMGDYAGLHIGARTQLVRESLNSLGAKLDPQFFVRIHRSTIVRLDRIHHLAPLSNRDCDATLCNGETLRVSRTYSAELWNALTGVRQ